MMFQPALTDHTVLPAAAHLPATYRDALRLCLRRGGPRALLLLVAVLLAARIGLAPWTWLDALLLVLPLAGRGLLEWTLHQYMWHARPLPWLGIRLPNAVTRMHQAHHEHPHDLDTLFFGWRSVMLATLLMLLLFPLLLPLPQALVLALSLLLVIAAYEWCHLVAHSRIRPRGAAFRRLIATHRHHHFRDARRALGVSSALGDRLFGTAVPERTVQETTA